MQGEGHHVKNILNFERMFVEGVLLISLAGGRGGAMELFLEQPIHLRPHYLLSASFASCSPPL